METHGGEGASEGVQGRARPSIVGRRPVSDRPVAGIPLPEHAVHAGHRVGNCLFLLDDLAQAREAWKGLLVPDAGVTTCVLHQVLDLLDLVRDHLDLVDDRLDRLERADGVLDQVGRVEHDRRVARDRRGREQDDRDHCDQVPGEPREKAGAPSDG